MAKKTTAAKAVKKPAGTESVADVLKDMDASPAERAPNAPPEVSFDSMLDDLMLEAENWCDGEPLATQEQADEVTRLVDAAAKLEREIEATRKAEKEPFLEGGRAVDAKFKPLTERAAKIIRVAKKALTPWLEAVQAEKRRVQLQAIKEAEEAKARLAEQHRATVNNATFADEQVTEQMELDAKEAEKRAKAIAKEAVVTRGGDTTVKLRAVWLVNIVDRRECLKHYMATRADELEAWLYEQARKDVRTGARSLPGCSIWSEQKAV